MTDTAATPTCSLRLQHRAGAVLIWPEGAPEPDPAWFDPDALAARGRLEAAGAGRGDARRFEAGGRTLVLRHYRRGGLAQHVSQDKYLRTGLRQSRPWRELALLTRLAAGEMPVPSPVAARVAPVAPLSPWYRGDLLTEYLHDTRTVADALRADGADAVDWARIGATIAAFHSVGVDHADLNAHNILLDGAERVYLIDFDRARLRLGSAWQRRNLRRLRRSLDKLSLGMGGVVFGESQWRRLLAGYRAA
ncbi:MAG: 3-deoxy-D-manno-octulosonic acid kinase [Halofilum sp. (in: g-proteobacteria)]|nr:3-deoxy-D-manno-octulosonic acid kinase [Halofilum sp. (in: g-proteobacteria)]